MSGLSPKARADVILDFRNSAEIGLHLMSRIYEMLAKQKYDHLTDAVADTIVRPAIQERNEGTILSRYRDKNIVKMIGAPNTSVPSAPKPKLTEEQQQTLMELRASKDLSAPQPPSLAAKKRRDEVAIEQYMRQRVDLPNEIAFPIARLIERSEVGMRQTLDDSVSLTLNLANIALDKTGKGDDDRFVAYATRLLLLLFYLKQQDKDEEAELLVNTLALLTPNLGAGMGNMLDLLYQKFSEKADADIYGNMENYAKQASQSVYDLIQQAKGSRKKPPSPKK